MERNRGRSKEQADALERFFAGMKVVEATAPLRVFANENDKRIAFRGDPKSCVLARACERLFGSSAVLIFKTIAYVDLPDSNGIRQVNRFYVNNNVRDQIIRYDETGEFPPGGFTFYIPPRTLDGDRQYQKDRKQRIKNGEHVVDVHKSAMLKGVFKGVKKAAMLTGIRDGSGMVHFVKP
jgi:hypothetical protein